MNGAGVRFRGRLYLGAAVTPIIIEKIGETLKNGQWPPLPLCVFALLCATATGFITMRAFYDGSSQRHEDEEKQAENGNGKHETNGKDNPTASVGG